MELGCLADNVEPSAFYEKVYRVRNDSSIMVHAKDMNEAKRYAECFVFAYLDYDLFSLEFLPTVLTVARLFPNVVFVRVQGRRAGYLPGGILPKSFPVLMFIAKNGRAKMYDGPHHNISAVVQFVKFLTGDTPLSWDNSPAHMSSTGFDTTIRRAEGQLVEFLRPPPKEKTNPLTDPLFVFSGIFTSSSLLYRMARFVQRNRSHR